MPVKKKHLTLCGGRAKRFREIKEQLEEQLGYEPSNPEVAGRLMEKW